METKNNLQEILMNLESDEGRKAFVSSDYFKFPKAEVYPVIKDFSDNGNFELAGYIARNADLFYEASVLYEKAGLLGDAADLAKRAGMKEKALELYEKCTPEYPFYFDYAGKIAEEMGMNEKAIEFYLKGYIESENRSYERDLKKLSKMIQPNESLKKIAHKGIKSLVKKNAFDSAINLAKEWDINEFNFIYKKAAKFYEKTKDKYKAIEYNEKIGNFQKIMELEAKDKNFLGAGRAAEQLGDLENAIKFYIKGEYFPSAAEVERRKGNFTEAIDFYVKAMDKNKFNKDYPKKAAQVALEAGMNEVALDFFEKGEEFCEAVNLAKKLGYSDKVNKMYKLALNKCEANTNFKEAERIAIEAGFQDKADFYKELNKLRRF